MDYYSFADFMFEVDRFYFFFVPSLELVLASLASAGEGLDLFIKVLVVILVSKIHMSVLVSGNNGGTLASKFSIIKSSKGTSSSHTHCLNVISVPVPNRVPEPKLHLSLGHVKRPTFTILVIIHSCAKMRRNWLTAGSK